MEQPTTAAEVEMAIASGEMDSNTPSVSNWDYCIMFGDIRPPTDKEGNQFAENDQKMVQFRERQKERRVVVNHLKSKRVGLQVSRKKGADGNTVYVLIRANTARLEQAAELLEVNKKLKEQFGGGYSPFTVERRDMFHKSEEDTFFRKSQRNFIIESIVKGGPEIHGAELNIADLTRRGVITKFFPLHDHGPRKELINKWASWRNFYRPQPLQDIRNYYGEEIAIYFAWLGFYTQWLLGASAVGAVAFALWLVDKYHGTEIGVWAVSLYCVFLALWATLFLEFWKRYNNTLSFQWGMEDFESKETQRADFYGEELLGMYQDGEWITLNPDVKYNFPIPAPQKYYPAIIRRLKLAAAVPIVFTMLAAVVILTIAVLSFRLFVQRADALGGSIAGAIVNAITIIFMNTIWKIVAIKLTNWENHRTQTAYDDSLIFKIFLFYFVNSYTSLYYIAFFKSGNRFWGQDTDALRDACKSGNADASIVSWGCMDELTIQLVTILAVNIVIGNLKEVGIPWLIGYIKLLLYKKKATKEGASADEPDPEAKALAALPQWERESKLAEYGGTFDEYSEMVIQYGYITLFAAAFPLAPLMAVVNNVIEVRSDAFKLLTAYSRPAYKGAQDIGNWYYILEVIGVVAVITNCLLIGFSLEAIYGILHESAFWTFGFLVILEHAIFLLKFLISILIPDVPGAVRKERAKQQFVEAETLKALSGITKTTWADEDSEKHLEDFDEDFSDDEEAGEESAKKEKKSKKEKKERKSANVTNEAEAQKASAASGEVAIDVKPQ